MCHLGPKLPAARHKASDPLQHQGEDGNHKLRRVALGIALISGDFSGIHISEIQCYFISVTSRRNIHKTTDMCSVNIQRWTCRKVGTVKVGALELGGL